MKLKFQFVLSKLGEKTVAVAVGRDNERFNGMINLNAGGEVLFSLLSQGDITREELLSRFAAHFGITEETAEPAVLRFLEELRQGGLLEETV